MKPPSYLILPGLGNSGPQHWQSLWEPRLKASRVMQDEWEKPVKEDWITRIDEYVMRENPSDVILIAHSLACCTVAFWAAKFHRDIRGAFLVGPSDVEAPSYPPGTTGFNPMPQGRIPFPTRVIASTDDFFVRIERARQFAQNWGSELIEVGPVGHINVASGHGPWPEGLRLLSEFEKNLPS